MTSLTVSFESKWLDERRAAGVRVVRLLEKWIGGTDGKFRLKGSTGTSLTVELDPKDRPEFAAALEKKVCSEFGAERAESVLSYSDAKARSRPVEPETPPEQKSPPATAEGGEKAADKPSEAAPPPDPKSVLENLLQEVPVRHSRALAGFFRETASVVPMLQRMDAMESFWRQSLLVSIDSGYGLSGFLSELAKLYAGLGIVKEVGEKTVREMKIGIPANDAFKYEDWEKAVDAAKDMDRANRRNEAGRAILCLNVGDWQGKLGTQEVRAFLRKLNVCSGSLTLVFRVPFVDSRTLAVTQDALSDVFAIRTLVVPPTELGNLTEYAQAELARRGFSLAADAQDALERWILEEKRDDSFFGYKTMDKLVGQMIYAKALANCQADQTDRVLSAADITSVSMPQDQRETNPQEELDALIGLKEVKQKLIEIVAQIKAQRKMSAKGSRVKRPAIHMLFSGNPGTGKTTVARIVARLLREEGVLRKGHLLEVKGRDLCGEYIGQTAPKTSAICRDAYGSVLFIDEAYSLFRGDGNDRDYGREALDTLIAEMENHRDDLCVIMAGYTDDMATMLGGNEGLRSRIPYSIEFPDYSRDELTEIFFTMLKGNFDYEKSLERDVREFFASIPDDVLKSRGFANARFVRNLYERTWGKAAYRSRLDDGEIRILASDLAGAAEEREFKQLMEKSVRRPIGFGGWAD